jgi:ComF family protein
MGEALGIARRAGQTLLDLVLPPRCPSCLEIVREQGSFCPSCWGALHFLSEPYCAVCGVPFPYAVGDGGRCGRCAADPPRFDSARAALVYNDASAALVLALKYADRTHLAEIMASMCARAAAASLERRPLVVPVPMHARRLRKRLYNQAVLIARSLARSTGCELAVDALRRTRPTPPTRGMSRRQRFENVRGAIRVPPAAAERVRGRDILVVDDVFTTGATAEACARALKRAGAARVDIVTLTRVTHDEVG